MALSRITKRILVWGPLSLFVLLVAPFIAAYLEAALIGTSRVENVFRWVGIHDAAMRLRDWLVL